jgi:cytochrome c556
MAGAPAAADPIATRVATYRSLGAAFKASNDGLRGGASQIAAIRQAAATIQKVSRLQYKLFPAGSGPRPGVKTAARPEIWSNPKGFRAAQDAFYTQADVYLKAAAGGDISAIKTEARKLGATCKGCHDNFRVAAD